MPKKPSKAKRKSWRKVNVEDVEEARDDANAIHRIKQQYLKGKAPVETKEVKEEDLFQVDTKGSCEGLSRSTRREIARAKLFPVKGPNIGNSASEEAKIARAEASLKLKRKRPTSEPEVFDLWAAPDPKAKAQQEANRAEAAASTVRLVPQKGPTTLPKKHKISNAPAVLPAHEGQSMNPETTAFEDLACMAAAKELEREAEVEALDRKMRPLTHELRDKKGAEAVKEMDEEAKVQAYRELMCPGAGDGEGEGEEGEAPGRRSKVQRIKAQAIRNRARKQKSIDAKQAQINQQKKLTKSVGEVGAILKEMKETEEWQNQRKQYKLEQRQKRKELEITDGMVPKTRRLGRTQFVEEAMVVPDSKAASNGLRSMPLPSGSAVKERLSSIMRRGLLPAPPEASKSENMRHKKKLHRLKKSRKFVSPLLRDNLLLR